ncbi:LytR C-terminal domain-containing protein [Agromyces seonyuensis]|uniref:LytR family transcriptional regulator n=1 Tax=Agromyces seonyuensis TaxID=2662446 RepID=A0A6I4P134_9MICO|nr:LytR C-terminal domain-containing protein [Agromyces seonyuensis]MWB97729.1 LytR family transcriptional regulator [Agromyces seonyuensis]
MPETFPKDRFDSIPRGIERVGAHRAPARRGRGWVWAGWTALAAVIVATAGILGAMGYLGKLGGSDETVVASEAPAVTAAPTLDAATPVTVLNGTDVDGLAATAADALTGAGLTVAATSNASTSDVAESMVYYSRPDLEGAARGIAGLLPGSDVQETTEFTAIGSDLTVVVGADYAAAVGG